MYRGTTPTFLFELDTAVDLSSMSQIWVTIRDGARIKHNWDITRVTIDNEHHTIGLWLSQQETLEMHPGIGAAQIRFLTTGGSAFTTERTQIYISPTLKGGVIS